MQALAIKYRPKNWGDVTEQNCIKSILENQLRNDELQHCYLFVGSAGTGKTTCARIFANQINKGQGNPIELDAASNNSVEDMRDLIAQAKTRSLDSEYKVFIVDECHMITVQGWNAVLKLIEEPPAKSIFIFCTTDPQKIPKTILSRVQRYDFQRISQQGIVERLNKICVEEHVVMNYAPVTSTHWKAIDYIAKIADGGMRDAITMLDKCLAYSSELTIENVVKTLGVANYDIMFKLTDALSCANDVEILNIIEELHTTGKDLKQFIKDYTHFILDIEKYMAGCDDKYISIPSIPEYMNKLNEYCNPKAFTFRDLLRALIELNSNIKYSSSPKVDIECALLLVEVCK